MSVRLPEWSNAPHAMESKRPRTPRRCRHDRQALLHESAQLLFMALVTAALRWGLPLLAPA